MGQKIYVPDISSTSTCVAWSCEIILAFRLSPETPASAMATRYLRRADVVEVCVDCSFLELMRNQVRNRDFEQTSQILGEAAASAPHPCHRQKRDLDQTTPFPMP